MGREHDNDNKEPLFHFHLKPAVVIASFNKANEKYVKWREID